MLGGRPRCFHSPASTRPSRRALFDQLIGSSRRTGGCEEYHFDCRVDI